MLGGGGSCGGPVSWWCSEVWRCSPKVAPDIASSSGEMANCDQCSVKFSLLKRRRTCANCHLVFCSSCIKTGIGGTRKCNKCIVLSQWPLDISEVGALRVKDLRQYLQSQHINSTTCTEKRELIELVTRHICSQRRMSDNARQNTGAGSGSIFSSTARPPVFKPPSTNITRDDGIRVRPSSTLNSDSSGSIRVRPVDSIRVRPSRSLSPDSSEYDPEMDLGIRVFASDSQAGQQERVSSTSPISMEGCSESTEDKCSQCPSEDCTASSCSLDSCPNRASSQPMPCTLHNDSSGQDSIEDVSATNDLQLPDSTSMLEEIPGTGEIAQDNTTTTVQEAEVLEQGVNTSETPGLEIPFEASAPQLEDDAPITTTMSSSSASSSTPSTASSPEPSKPLPNKVVALADLKSEEDIRRLSVRQCKELLALHRVNYSGITEKSELLNKIDMLWKDYQNARQDVEGLPEELLCKICMDSTIDCVFLECGHMIACTQCGKQMAECPVCRQYVVRVVRTFRA